MPTATKAAAKKYFFINYFPFKLSFHEQVQINSSIFSVGLKRSPTR
jgi:hypothetical protein